MNRWHARLRCSLLVLSGFLALSAIPGGAMLLAGIYTPPVEQLAGSAFSSYLVPGLALGGIVGGSAALAATLLARRHRFASAAAALAGAAVMTFEFVEVLAIGSPAGPAFVMQLAYFAIGLTLVALASVDFALAARSGRVDRESV